MNIAECSHIRIRGGNIYGMNVERMIKHLEDLYQIDFRTLPRWEQLVQRMHVAITDCNRKIQDSKLRKATIIDKLYIESSRPSPFELTDGMVRTAMKWEIMNANLKAKKKSIISLTESVQTGTPEQIEYPEIPGEESPLHPNTEAVASAVEAEGVKEEISTVPETHLPVYVCSNQHKRISLLGSNASFLSVADSGPKTTHMKYDKKPDEWLVLRQSTNLISAPNTITIRNKSLKEQTISFSVVNCDVCSHEYPYLNLRYKGVTDSTPFRRAKILPVTPVKLFPGLPVNFKFVFKLQQCEENFASHLFFRVGQKVVAEAPVEGFSIPVIGAFVIPAATIHVSEKVNIPSSYFWHINAKCGFPTGKLIINVPDNQCCDLRITKLNINLTQDSENDIYSIEPTLSSGTMFQREQDQEVIDQSKTFVSSNECLEDTESVIIANSVVLILQGVIQQALDVFVFEKTFLHLKPFSKNTIQVFQTKAEHVGFHQNLYELEFMDPISGETVSRKTTKVFGDVLPNPIQIYPVLLDMTKSPIVQGRCEDYFTITNTHRLFPVTVKIKLPAKLKKLIRLTPMETFIPTSSRVNFVVSFCSRDLNKPLNDFFLHATIEIIVIGDKSVYRNLPPIYYEILAPCSSEFMKLCKHHVFDDLTQFDRKPSTE